jgi:hypothetical protein
MFLVRLVYCSTVSEGFAEKDIEHIIDSARSNNKVINVTGLLCFNHKYFLQCLEGSRDSVNETYHRILKDNRHTDPIILDYKEIDCREFTQWTMGYVPKSSLTKAINIKYSGSSEFNPYEMSGESCHAMLLELSRNIPNI